LHTNRNRPPWQRPCRTPKCDAGPGDVRTSDQLEGEVTPMRRLEPVLPRIYAHFCCEQKTDKRNFCEKLSDFNRFTRIFFFCVGHQTTGIAKWWSLGNHDQTEAKVETSSGA
jgi:hypothetical protein